MSLGVARWYYTQSLPTRAIGVAQVSAKLATVDSLMDVDNTSLFQAPLGVWLDSTPTTNPPNFLASALNQTIQIYGSTQYVVFNQFFEITPYVSGLGNPLYYTHILPTAATNVAITDLLGNVILADILISNGLLCHSMDGDAYLVKYVSPNGQVTSTLLTYTPALTRAVYDVGATYYTLTQCQLQVATNATLYIRFTSQSAYSVDLPYNTQLNYPWYARIGFPLNRPAPEYFNQVWIPSRPYLLGAWITGQVLSPNIVEFERKGIYLDPVNLPDILVFDNKYNLRYAIEGTALSSPTRKGSEYTWARGLITTIDYNKARIGLNVTLNTTDIVYAFYSYSESDYLYRGLDLNPFTNPSVGNKIIQFYYKSNGVNPFNYVYHQVIDPNTGPIAGATNDPSPTTGTNQVFSTVVVGSNVAISDINITDIRTRGGGLASSYQNIPEANSCWDIGYFDGKPYPISGVLVVYLPASVLTSLDREDVLAKITNILPAGVLPVVRYYNEDGSEEV